MLSGVGIICFTASYGVALVLELTRLLFRSGIRGALLLGFTGAGLLAHSLFLYYRAASAIGSPLSSEQDWYLWAAWALAGTYLYLTYYHPRTAFGLFVLPLVLALIGVAVFLADPQPFARKPASQVWAAIHALSILLAVVAVLVGFVAGVMYFQQARRLKRKLPPPRRLRLPSLEWLDRANSRAIVVSTLMMGVGVLSGVLLKLINHAGQTDSVPWNDPVVLSTMILFGWLVLAVAIGLIFKSARAGRKVAFLTLASFVFLVVVLGVGLLMDTQHGGKNRSPTPACHSPCTVEGGTS